jgi:3-phosphoshikimate 1-carboxyvinyltransferase
MAKLSGQLQVPGDKSISHRALIFSALARGECIVTGLSPAADCASTAFCLRNVGLTIAHLSDGQVRIESPGLGNLTAPAGILDAGNSGTTMRVLAGLLAGSTFDSTFDGDDSLRSRPMRRVLDPLAKMGAQVTFQNRDGYAPFTLTGGSLTGISFSSTIASAQVQTAVLLAGLQAHGQTKIEIPEQARDHTTRMFKHIGVPFEQSEGYLSVTRLSSPIEWFAIDVPADISSAAFFMVAAACTPGSDITLMNVGINPGRRLVIDVLRRMGADISEVNPRIVCEEPIADIKIRYQGRLIGGTISGAEVAAGIDELPILALAASLCSGVFRVTGATELRVKESDRIATITGNISAAGGNIREFEDGFEIEGKPSLPGGSKWRTFGDHRLAMTGMIASILCEHPLDIDDPACASVSYPSFEADLSRVLT